MNRGEVVKMEDFASPDNIICILYGHQMETFFYADCHEIRAGEQCTICGLERIMCLIDKNGWFLKGIIHERNPRLS